MLTPFLSKILTEHGDIAEVMEIFGVKRVKEHSVRILLAKGLTLEWAARFHRVPLDQFMEILEQALSKNKERSAP